MPVPVNHSRPALLLATLGLACSASRLSPETLASERETTLRGAFAEHFKVGVAIPADVFVGSEHAAARLVKEQFNRITAENETKWKGVHASRTLFDFAVADGFVRFGKRNGLEVHGHTLVWHTDQPAWLFKSENGGPIDRDELLARMKKHIDKVAGRYRGEIAYWDVVNEAFEDDGTWRKSEWYTIIGEDYIEQAFMMAADAAPDAKLVYNDYNLWMPAKRDAAVALVERLRSKNIRIDAIGEQGHYRTTGDPTIEQVEEAIVAFKNAGVEVLISEFDVDPLPFAWDISANAQAIAERRAELDPYVDGFPEEAEDAQAQRYADLFRVFVKHSDAIEAVTFWGLSDGASWLNYLPVPGRTNYPLLYDRQLRRKKAWYAIMAVAGE